MAAWSVGTRLISSGICRLKECGPASPRPASHRTLLSYGLD